jgi:hypothetical protein
VFAISLPCSAGAQAQNTSDSVLPEPKRIASGDAAGKPPSANESVRDVYSFADFASFAPRNALDMLERVPGFTIRSENDQRGLGAASGNILINGERFASKSTSARDQLARIPANNVVRIEIVDGASLDIPGLSGRIANVIAQSGGISGQFEWRPQFSTGPGKFRWSGGDISASGTRGAANFTLALENRAFYRGLEGPNIVVDGSGQTDRRFNTRYTVSDQPAATGSFDFNLPGGATANVNLTYARVIRREREREFRSDPLLPFYEESLRTLNDRNGFAIGGDLDFAFGPGRLRLIGLGSNDHETHTSTVLVREGEEEDLGTRFSRDFKEAERIGRAEYSWAMLNGDWQLSSEAAFNKFDSIAELFAFDPNSGTFVPVDFPNGSGGVREDRYEAIVSHGRPLASDLGMQLTLGGEISEISQTGADALSRRFERPKGSLSLAWGAVDGLDVNFEIARRVGQLDFGDFLADVNIGDNNTDSGNNQLRPPQSWEIELEIAKNLGAWGSTTLRLFDNRIEDFVAVVLIEGGGQSRGNIDNARRYGINFDATIRTDPIGLQGGQFTVELEAEHSKLEDPVTTEGRRFDRSRPRDFEVEFRHDIPATQWAYGLEFRDTIYARYFRISESGLDYNIATWGSVYVENKDALGMTMRVQASNLFNGGSFLSRTVFDGPRDVTPILFTEDRLRKEGYVFSFLVAGSF